MPDGQTPTERLLRLPEVSKRVGLKRSPIYRRIALPADHPEKFPAPVKLGRHSAWAESEVLRWIEARKAARHAA